MLTSRNFSKNFFFEIPSNPNPNDACYLLLTCVMFQKRLQLFDLSKGLRPSGMTESFMTRMMRGQIALCYSTERNILLILVQVLQCHYDSNPNAATNRLQNWVKQARERFSRKYVNVAVSGAKVAFIREVSVKLCVFELINGVCV